MAVKHFRKQAVAAVIILFSSLLGVYLTTNTQLQMLDEGATNLFFQIRPSRTVEDVAIVMVDETAVEEKYGYYDPLPRAYLAQLIDTLSSKGARWIGIDIAFLKTLPMLDPAGDTLLAESLRRANNVFAANLFHEGEEGLYVQHPDSFFMKWMRGTGHAMLKITGSGMRASAREVWPTMVMSDGQKLLSFSAMAYCLSQNVSADEFETKFANLPLTSEGTLKINFAGPPARWRRQDDGNWVQVESGAIPTFRSSRLTGESEFPSELLRDKMVWIGNGSEFVPDRFLTPFYKPGKDNWMYGAEVHANAFLTLRDESFLLAIPVWLVFAIGIVLAFCMTWATVKLEFVGEILVAILLVLSVWTAGYLLFSTQGILTPANSLTIVVVFAYFATSIYQALTEERTKKQIKTMFGRYAPPAYVEELIKDPSKLNLGGEDKEISVLFSDIEGFTSISEKMEPARLVELLNEYLGSMTKEIFNQGGTLDKYIGDAIVAVFGAPLPQNEHALHACYAALDMQTALKELRQRWSDAGLPAIKSRVGINTGHVVFGNIGSEIRYDYTAIGDQMNLGSRLEGANKEYGTYIMISEFTYDQVRERVIVRDLDSIIVKGKSKPVKVFELVGRSNEPMSDNLRRMIECYQEGMRKYRQRQFAEAVSSFEQALTFIHTDEASRLYVKRCREFIAEPPPDDWDGTYTMKSK